MGPVPRIAKELAVDLTDDGVLDAVDKVVVYYNENAKTGERLGKMVERVGLEPFKAVLA